MRFAVKLRVQLNPELPNWIDWEDLGSRKTLRGAQTLAEKKIGRIYGLAERGAYLEATTAIGCVRIYRSVW